MDPKLNAKIYHPTLPHILSLKSLRNSFNSVQKELGLTKRGQRPFYGVVEKMISYAKYLATNVPNPDLRMKLWLNSPEHLTGNHAHCIHPDQIKKIGRSRKDLKTTFAVWKKGTNEPGSKKALLKYVEKTAPIIKVCERSM